MNLTSTEKKSLALVALFLIIGASARFLDRRQVQLDPTQTFEYAALPASSAFAGISHVLEAPVAASEENAVPTDNVEQFEAESSIETLGEFAPDEVSPVRTPVTPSALNLNSASVVELTRLKGVGPKTAEAIVALRRTRGPFRKVEDLLEVKGIGKKKLENIRPYVIVSDH